MPQFDISYLQYGLLGILAMSFGWAGYWVPKWVDRLVKKAERKQELEFLERKENRDTDDAIRKHEQEIRHAIANKLAEELAGIKLEMIKNNGAMIESLAILRGAVDHVCRYERERSKPIVK